MSSIAGRSGDDGCRPHVTPEQIEALRAEARYASERLDLYRAKMYGPRPTTITRLNELERLQQGAAQRLLRTVAL